MKRLAETMSISEVRSRLLRLADDINRGPGPHAVTVTRRGRPVMALVDWDLYECIVETLEILGDPQLIADLRDSLRQLKAGKAIPWRQARAKLGV